MHVNSAPTDAQGVLATFSAPQLVRFLVRYAYQLTLLGCGTYVPGGEDLQDPKLTRLTNETVHRSLDQAAACLEGRTPRRPLCRVLFEHDPPAMRQVAKSAFHDACKKISERTVQLDTGQYCHIRGPEGLLIGIARELNCGRPG
jgi:hypothetical protein